VEPTRTTRTQAILEQLDWAAEEYNRAKEQFDQAMVRFQAARERFAGIKKMAQKVLPELQFIMWSNQHPEVRYTAMPLGEAIQQVLWSAAWEQAIRYLRDETRTYVPERTLDAIVNDLDGGGFDFQSATPLREVNAALMRLGGIKPGKFKGSFTLENAEEILEFARSVEPTKEDIPFE